MLIFKEFDAYRPNNSFPLESEHHPKSTGSGNEWFPLWTSFSSPLILSSTSPSKRAFLIGLSTCVSRLRVIAVWALSGFSCLTICASAFSRAASARESMFPNGAIVWSAVKRSTSRLDWQSSCNPRSLSMSQGLWCRWLSAWDSARVEISDWREGMSCFWGLDLWIYFVSNPFPWCFWTNGSESVHISTKCDICKISLLSRLLDLRAASRCRRSNSSILPCIEVICPSTTRSRLPNSVSDKPWVE